jgi:hypothetical protein
LSKKYNVIVDPINPDLVICTNLTPIETEEDTFLKCLPPKYDNNKTFLFLSGEETNFLKILERPNTYVIGYEPITHPNYLRQPSCIMDAWTLFDECRLTDSPFDWLTKERDFNKIKNRNTGFCTITQANHNDMRLKVFNKLCEYKLVASSGPWQKNITNGQSGIDKTQWYNPIFSGRFDGLMYREKIEFFQKYKFNIAMQLKNTPFIIQEKMFHAYFSGAIPIFYGNEKILFDKFNPNSFINIHDYKDNLDEFLNLIKEIDNNESLYKQYIKEPIYVDNKLPEYIDFDYTLDFLTKVVDKSTFKLF